MDKIQRPISSIPPHVAELLDFKVRGYYKETSNPAHESAATIYMHQLEKTVDIFKQVLRQLYAEQADAEAKIKAFFQKWEDDGTTIVRASDDPSEYVAGL
jgi:hypothetical protein